MKKLLVAIDGSEGSLGALRTAIADRAALADPAGCELHLVNVQHPVTGTVSSFVARKNVDDYHRDAGMGELAPALEVAKAAGVAVQHHVIVGEYGEALVRFAQQIGCDRIVMGSRGLSGVSSVVMGSVCRSVLEHAEVPVLVVR